MTEKKSSTGVAGMIEEILEPISEKLNCEIVDVEYLKEAGEYILRIFVDREGEPVDHEFCQLVSDELSIILDEQDPIEENYFLEISSPGIERTLKKEKDFLKYIGKKIHVKLFVQLNGTKEYIGILEKFSDDIITIRPEKTKKNKSKDIPAVVEIELSKVAKAKNVFEF